MRAAPPEPEPLQLAGSGEQFLVLGDSGVGKTCLLYQYTDGPVPHPVHLHRGHRLPREAAGKCKRLFIL
ncbi:GM18970 [Drosophila sechellia]|uniref:GM18970 n=1 Tax=Drosophila sechellia TaxID=7238 RepID=B4I9F2_DROSE|nr:GM18970 [Drosophila sechellia]